jgi:hypothetical protein
VPYSKAMSDKELALETVQKCSESASLHEITLELQLLNDLREANRAIDEGHFKTHEAVGEMLKSWATK